MKRQARDAERLVGDRRELEDAVDLRAGEVADDAEVRRQLALAGIETRSVVWTIVGVSKGTV